MEAIVGRESVVDSRGAEVAGGERGWQQINEFAVVRIGLTGGSTRSVKRAPRSLRAPSWKRSSDPFFDAQLHRRSVELSVRRMEPAGFSLRQPGANGLNRGEIRG